LQTFGSGVGAFFDCIIAHLSDAAIHAAPIPRIGNRAVTATIRATSAPCDFNLPETQKPQNSAALNDA